MGTKWYMALACLGFSLWGTMEIFKGGDPIFGALLLVCSAIYYCADELIQIKEAVS